MWVGLGILESLRASVNGLSRRLWLEHLGQILLMLEHINLTYCICFPRHPRTGERYIDRRPGSTLAAGCL